MAAAFRYGVTSCSIIPSSCPSFPTTSPCWTGTMGQVRTIPPCALLPRVGGPSGSVRGRLRGTPFSHASRMPTAISARWPDWGWSTVPAASSTPTGATMDTISRSDSAGTATSMGQSKRGLAARPATRTLICGLGLSSLGQEAIRLWPRCASWPSSTPGQE